MLASVAMAVVLASGPPAVPASAPAPAVALRPRITPAHKTWTSKGRVCSFDVTYPKVSGIPGEAAINQIIEASFLSERPFRAECALAKDAQRTAIEASYSIGLEDAGLLSFRYSGLESVLGDNGDPEGAHPTKLYHGVTVSLADRKQVGWRSLFRQDAYGKIEARLAAQAGPIDKRRDRDFFLTRAAVVVLNLFDNFAMGSVQGVLRVAAVAPLAAPGGAVATLAALPALADPSGIYGDVTILAVDDAWAISFGPKTGKKLPCTLIAAPSAGDTLRFQDAPEDRVEISESAIGIHARCEGEARSLELSRAGVKAPVACTVTAAQATFWDADTGEERLAYVVKGDKVDTAASSERGKTIARFRGTKGSTLGLLETRSLSCPRRP